MFTYGHANCPSVEEHTPAEVGGRSVSDVQYRITKNLSLNSNISFQPTSNRPQPLHQHLPTKCQSSKGERSLKEVGVSGPSAVYQAEYK